MAADISFLVTGGALRGPLLGQMLSGDESEFEHLQPGTPLGPFLLRRRVGAGGSGIVFLAERIEGFEQWVAIKVVRPEALLRERFRLERSFLARLEHPGIARIIDGGESDDGFLWLAMEYIEGESISTYCGRVGADWIARLNLVTRICDALQFAHRHLIAHGDIKPSNILVDAQGVPRLLDFGISSSCADAVGADCGYAFTPGYASPEQLAGERLTLASDIYQMGRLLATLIPASLPMPQLTRRNLAALIARATAPLPADRNESVADLRNDLHRVLVGRPCVAKRWPLMQRAGFFVRRAWRSLAMASMLLSVLVGMATFYTLQVREQRNRADIEARSARVTSDFMQDMFRMAPPGDGHTGTAADMLDHSARRLKAMTSALPLDRTILIEAIAGANLDLGRAEQAEDILEHYADADLFDASVPPALQARLLVLKARAKVRQGKVKLAEPLVTRAERLLPKLGAKEAEAIGIQRARVRAEIARSNKTFQDAERILQLALQHYRGGASIEVAGALSDLAWIHSMTGKSQQAIASLRRSEAMLAELIGMQARSTLEMQRTLSFWLAVSDRPDEAEQVLAQQEAVIRENFGEQSTEFAELLGSRGVIAYMSGKHVSAISHFRQQLQLQQQNGLGESRRSIKARHNLAVALLETGHLDEAIVLLREALRLRLKTLSFREQEVMLNQFVLSRALCMHGEWQESEQLFESTITLYQEVVGPNSDGESDALRHRAECLIDGGRLTQARDLLARRVTAAHWAGLSPPDHARLSKVFSAAGVAPPTP